MLGLQYGHTEAPWGQQGLTQWKAFKLPVCLGHERNGNRELKRPVSAIIEPRRKGAKTENKGSSVVLVLCFDGALLRQANWIQLPLTHSAGAKRKDKSFFSASIS